MPERWRREDVRVNMVVTRDDLADADPLLYRVVAICDEPTVVLAPLYLRDGEDREHHVIASPGFAEFHLVRAAGEPGQFSVDYGKRDG